MGLLFDYVEGSIDECNRFEAIKEGESISVEQNKRKCLRWFIRYIGHVFHLMKEIGKQLNRLNQHR